MTLALTFRTVKPRHRSAFLRAFAVRAAQGTHWYDACLSERARIGFTAAKTAMTQPSQPETIRHKLLMLPWRIACF
ncbi:MAG TPA: hypothetical protein VFN86_07125, partial [Casimicrobiaceae bacterium]|nr:hypothetical protein [Casimicrobiaceae bacterium]